MKMYGECNVKTDCNIYSRANVQFNHINCVISLSWRWTQIKGSKHVGQWNYTINVIKLYICRVINIELKCTECIILSVQTVMLQMIKFTSLFWLRNKNFVIPKVYPCVSAR
jgi:hypothetical protein